MSFDPAPGSSTAPPTRRFLPPDADLHDSMLVARLAGLLVRFDRLLADEVRDHLEARADQLAGSGERAASIRRLETAHRYRLLAQSIDSASPQGAYLGS